MFAFLRENMLSLQGISMSALGKAEISLDHHCQGTCTALHSRAEGRQLLIRILECRACANDTHLPAADIWHWPAQPGFTDFKFTLSKCCIPKKVLLVFFWRPDNFRFLFNLDKKPCDTLPVACVTSNLFYKHLWNLFPKFYISIRKCKSQDSEIKT